MNDDKTQYKAFIELVESSKKDLMETCGYDEIVIDDFYDTFITALKKLDSIKKIDAQEHLMAVLCNHDSANYLIMYARFMAACFLKKNAILYEGFVGDVHAFCTKEVE